MSRIFYIIDSSKNLNTENLFIYIGTRINRTAEYKYLLRLLLRLINLQRSTIPNQTFTNNMT